MGIKSLQKIYKADINVARAGLSQSTRIVAPDEDATGETSQEVQEFKGRPRDLLWMRLPKLFQ